MNVVHIRLMGVRMASSVQKKKTPQRQRSTWDKIARAGTKSAPEQRLRKQKGKKQKRRQKAESRRRRLREAERRNERDKLA